MEIKYKTCVKDPLSTIIANELRQDIMINILKTGEHLSEVSLAERFGVSRGPIRDALSTLINEGIVKNLPNGWTVVNGFSLSDMEAYYRLRLYIETQAISFIFSNPLDDDFYKWAKALVSFVEDSDSFLSFRSEDTYNEMDIQFHQAIVDRANCGLYSQIMRILSNYSRSIMNLNRRFLLEQKFPDLKENEQYDKLLHDQSHLLIAKAFLAGDKEATLNNVKTHTEKGVSLYKKIIACVSELVECEKTT